MKWQIRLLQVAENELMALPADLRAQFLHIAELLSEFGPHKVGMPHIRHLENKLWEIRMTGRDGIARAIYVASSEQNLIVLHVFKKKTQKTPRKAINIAHERRRKLNDE